MTNAEKALKEYAKANEPIPTSQSNNSQAPNKVIIQNDDLNWDGLIKQSEEYEKSQKQKGLIYDLDKGWIEDEERKNKISVFGKEMTEEELDEAIAEYRSRRA